MKNYKSLQNIKMELFDAPNDIKKAFNRVVSYFASLNKTKRNLGNIGITINKMMENNVLPVTPLFSKYIELGIMNSTLSLQLSRYLEK